MLARFSVAYERFCRLLLTIFVVNIAMLVHTLLGAVVLGFFPSCAAAPHAAVCRAGAAAAADAPAPQRGV